MPDYARLRVNTDEYLEALMKEFSDEIDMNALPENDDPQKWLEARCNQLDNGLLMASHRLLAAQEGGFLHWAEYSSAYKKYQVAFEERRVDAAYKCNEAITKRSLVASAR